MNDILRELLRKKSRLDKYKPIPKNILDNLEEWYRIELTYTSNAIEGNTLTRQETALVVEKGITVGGKILQEHLEAINHANALEFIHGLINPKTPAISHTHILAIHQLLLQPIHDVTAGRL